MSRWYHRSCSLLPAAAPLAVLLVCVAPAAARTITGVCPDGSIFIVQRAEAIPCSDAKQVEPHEVPPLNPEFLPRPYGWERFNQETDPNNPYNVVDSVRSGSGPGGAPPAPPTPPRNALRGASNRPPSTVPGGGLQPSPPALPPVSAAAPSDPVLGLGIGANDLRDLAAIVEMMQEHAPAGVVRRDAAGTPLAVARVARSAAFDARVRAALQRRGAPVVGPVVLFDVVSAAHGSFYGNFTFVQGHVAFHPDTSNPHQFGILDGELGSVAPGEALLGYVVLPAHFDLGQPLDLYWNDLQITATLRP